MLTMLTLDSATERPTKGIYLMTFTVLTPSPSRGRRWAHSQGRVRLIGSSYVNRVSMAVVRLCKAVCKVGLYTDYEF